MTEFTSLHKGKYACSTANPQRNSHQGRDCICSLSSCQSSSPSTIASVHLTSLHKKNKERSEKVGLGSGQRCRGWVDVETSRKIRPKGWRTSNGATHSNKKILKCQTFRPTPAAHSHIRLLLPDYIDLRATQSEATSGEILGQFLFYRVFFSLSLSAQTLFNCPPFLSISSCQRPLWWLFE